MATKLRRKVSQERPWAARVRSDGDRFFLGYFPTRNEAEEAERQARLSLPDRRKEPLRW